MLYLCVCLCVCERDRGIKILSKNYCKCYLRCKVQALVYDILFPIAAIIDYATGLEKLSASKQFFVGAQSQMAVSL